MGIICCVVIVGLTVLGLGAIAGITVGIVMACRTTTASSSSSALQHVRRGERTTAASSADDVDHVGRNNIPMLFRGAGATRPSSTIMPTIIMSGTTSMGQVLPMMQEQGAVDGADLRSQLMTIFEEVENQPLNLRIASLLSDTSAGGRRTRYPVPDTMVKSWVKRVSTVSLDVLNQAVREDGGNLDFVAIIRKNCVVMRDLLIDVENLLKQGYSDVALQKAGQDFLTQFFQELQREGYSLSRVGNIPAVLHRGRPIRFRVGGLTAESVKQLRTDIRAALQ
ncbi:unnamed protein product [Amoebophrya sp. A25]|nr:unnamed protein product [Amoebophrya sp. A25]CAD7977014.1 unnamed protein product [Amoebophrya sp. A25]|eukprot:GSA25T00027843001.1